MSRFRKQKPCELRGKINKPESTLDVVQLDFVESNFRQRLGDEFNDVVVVDDLVDVALIVGAGKDDNLALVPHHLAELLEFVKEHESIDDGHVDVQEDDVRKIVRRRLIFFQIIQSALSRVLHFHSLRELRDLDDTLTDEIISLIIIDKHYQIDRLCCFSKHPQQSL
jgi:hypothetical protein